ncbi:MAG: phosphate acyltransferase PlsX [Ruminococcaceae bacterium]|nr:phosphate acyltransferase PlsX [Oscillospiraceae bacterium]
MNDIIIAVDIMGGDKAPIEIAKGAIAGAKENGVKLLLCGAESEIKNAIEQFDGKNVVADTIFTDVFMTMEDSPMFVMKEKVESSMSKAVTALKNGEAHAVVSPGNTGALFTAASLTVRRIKGIRRAALGAVLPLEKPFLLLDSGANPSALPENLEQFALLGSIYVEKVLGISNPKVGLLNNGTEETKGNELCLATLPLLKELPINFIGNCEGRDLPCGVVDVAVCDGFTGNVTVKLIEGMGVFFKKKLNTMFYASPITKLSGLLVKPELKKLKKSIDHREFGGAPFLGIAKPVIKAHGSSDARSIETCIKQAKLYYQSNVAEIISENQK